MLSYLQRKSRSGQYGRDIHEGQVILALFFYMFGADLPTRRLSGLDNREAEKEKHFVALSPVLAAIFLTLIKIVVGLLTNSLGILSEAAHSGLDLIAAGVTFFAVKVSGRPADREHQYGHGKVENLSALIETVLLLLTCAWIIYEAIHRLIEPVQVEVSFWSFAVMGTSIIVDVTRSRALMRVARKHNSQALEADALRFSTDVWSSSVVIVGLIGVWLARWLSGQFGLQVEWLSRADAVAALGVSVIVIYVSYQLGRRTIDVLLDSASTDLTDRVVTEVRTIPGVLAVRRMRLRQSGPSYFADVTVDVNRYASLEEAHQIAVSVEQAVQSLLPRSDVVVHIDPSADGERNILEQIRNAAISRGLRVHAIQAYDVRDTLDLSMHVEVPKDMTVAQAHDLASDFESAVRDAIPDADEVVTHIEPVGGSNPSRKGWGVGHDEIRRKVSEMVDQMPGVKRCHNLAIYHGSGLSVSFHCVMDPDLPVSDAHQITERLEIALRAQLPELEDVVIHFEPSGVAQ